MSTADAIVHLPVRRLSRGCTVLDAVRKGYLTADDVMALAVDDAVPMLLAVEGEPLTWVADADRWALWAEVRPLLVEGAADGCHRAVEAYYVASQWVEKAGTAAGAGKTYLLFERLRGPSSTSPSDGLGCS